MSETFIALLITLAIAVALPGAMVGLSLVVGPRRYSPTKELPVESGVTHTVGTARERFSIKFYLVAILLIVFDVEAVFLFPWAVNFRGLGMDGFLQMIVFMAMLMLGFYYVIKKGILNWE